MIRTHRAQLDLGDEFIAGFIAEGSDDLWEPWMRQVDSALDDERLLEITRDAWNRLCKKSKTRGRPAAPAEVILRLLLLKHIRDWSYEELQREVRANLVYRQFTRIGGGPVPDDKSMSRFSRRLGAAVIEKLHQRVVGIAQEKKIVPGRKLRVDTTVVETNIHYRMSRLKLVYSAGVNPARARVRGSVAWIVRRKETESREPIDKAVEGW
jgi:transposase, IS5 family